MNFVKYSSCEIDKYKQQLNEDESFAKFVIRTLTLGRYFE